MTPAPRAIAIAVAMAGVWLGGRPGAAQAPGPPAASQAEPPRTVWDGVYSAAQAERGAFTYGRYCARCHGADLRGPALGRRLPGQSPAPAVAGDEFRWRWHGLPLGDLAARIRNSMPPDNPGALSRRDGVDVLAFVLSRNGLPEGGADLPEEMSALETIAFLAARP